ncbi:MAG: peptide chain release factor N(5)-glutamine methyltransferase, partial [Candidatus Methylomirabilis sp.]|nr:peptide chain release factor N(5)-glutamine methyltransferase [Deltaproteobacteria bacterium]
MSSNETWTVGRVLAATTEHLARKGVPSARLDAELLLAHALGCDRVRLYLDQDKPLAEPERDRYREAVRRRAAREPVAYITGLRGFWEQEFVVTP